LNIHRDITITADEVIDHFARLIDVLILFFDSLCLWFFNVATDFFLLQNKVVKTKQLTTKQCIMYKQQQNDAFCV